MKNRGNTDRMPGEHEFKTNGKPTPMENRGNADEPRDAEPDENDEAIAVNMAVEEQMVKPLV